MAAVDILNTLAQSLNTIESVGAAEKKQRTAPPPALAEQYTVIVNRYYFKNRPSVEAFVDHGDRLRTRHDSPDVVQGMLTLAESRDWDALKVSGRHAFKQTVWLEASLRGLAVSGYPLTAQDQAALAARRQAHEPAPSAAILRPAANPAPMAERLPAAALSPVSSSVPPLSAESAPSPAGRDPSRDADQQREARQAAIRAQVLQQDWQERERQAAEAQAAEEKQAAQEEKAKQLREAFDTLDKRTAMERFPELTGLYPLVAEAARFAKERLHDPQNRADFIADITAKGIQHLVRGETLPQPTLSAAPEQSQSQHQHQTDTRARRALLLLVALLIAWRIAPPALASGENDACGAILCLAGEMRGASGGGECNHYLERYFTIVEKHHGDFSPSRTARKRMDFLEQCPSGESETRQQVNDRYGTRLGL